MTQTNCKPVSCGAGNRAKVTSRHREAKLKAVRSFADFQAGKGSLGYPLEVFLEVSNLCNMRCVMCDAFSALNPYRLNAECADDLQLMDFDALRSSLGSVLEHALAVHCFGYGEATIHPKFRQMIEMIAHYEVLVDFFTNGMRLTGELADFLVDQRVWKVTFSLSGTTAEEYEKVYLGGNFAKVLSGIKSLARSKSRARTEFPLIHVNSIGFEHHIRRLDEFVELMADCGVNGLTVHPLVVNPHMPFLVHHSAVYRPDVHYAVFARAGKIAARHGMTLDLDPFISECARDEDESQQIRRRRVAGVSGSKTDPLASAPVPIERFPEMSKSVRCLRNDQRPPRPYTLVDLTTESREQVAAKLGPFDEYPDFLCWEPFKTLFISSTGMTRPCCFADRRTSFGDLAVLPGEEVWGGAGFEVVRDAIRSGRYPRCCQICLQRGTAPKNHGVDGLWDSYVPWFNQYFDQPIYVPPDMMVRRALRKLYKRARLLLSRFPFGRGKSRPARRAA